MGKLTEKERDLLVEFLGELFDDITAGRIDRGEFIGGFSGNISEENEVDIYGLMGWFYECVAMYKRRILKQPLDE